MPDNHRKAQKERRFPGLYEKLIPIVLGIIVVAVVAVLIFAVAVALRLAPGAGY